MDGFWAPASRALLALHEAITGYGAGIKTTQCIASIGIIVLLFHVARRFANPRAGLWAVWLYALSPTQIFCSISLVGMLVWRTVVAGCLDISSVAERQEHSCLKISGIHRTFGWIVCAVSRCGNAYASDILCGSIVATIK